MEAVSAKIPLHYSSEDPMSKVAHALVQHLSSQLSIGEHMEYSKGNTGATTLTSKYQKHSAKQTDMQGTDQHRFVKKNNKNKQNL